MPRHRLVAPRGKGGKKAKDSGKNEPHGNQDAIEKADKQVEKIHDKIDELKKQPGTSRKIKQLKQRQKNITKDARQKASGEHHGQRGKKGKR